MKFSIPLLLLYNFTLFSQSNLPNYSLEMFSKDTAVMSKYAINIPIEKKAELYALASYWKIENWGSTPDTINWSHYYSRKYQKKEIKRLKKEYLDVKNKPTDWKVCYFFDLNQDSKLDIIEISKRGTDTTELWYPSLFDNHIRLFLSSRSKYYNFYYLPGRITSLTTIKNEFYFTTISLSCCDESEVTRITKLHIPKNASEPVYDIRFWANGDNRDLSYDNFGYNLCCNFPKHFNTIKYYLLKEELSINSGVYGSHGQTMIKFPKHEIVRIISESENYYYIEFKVKSPEEEKNWIFSDNTYMIRWLKKRDFEKIAVRLD